MCVIERWSVLDRNGNRTSRDRLQPCANGSRLFPCRDLEIRDLSKTSRAQHGVGQEDNQYSSHAAELPVSRSRSIVDRFKLARRIPFLGRKQRVRHAEVGGESASAYKVLTELQEPSWPSYETTNQPHRSKSLQAGRRYYEDTRLGSTNVDLSPIGPTQLHSDTHQAAHHESSHNYGLFESDEKQIKGNEHADRAWAPGPPMAPQLVATPSNASDASVAPYDIVGPSGLQRRNTTGSASRQYPRRGNIRGPGYRRGSPASSSHEQRRGSADAGRRSCTPDHRRHRSSPRLRDRSIDAGRRSRTPKNRSDSNRRANRSLEKKHAEPREQGLVYSNASRQQKSIDKSHEPASQRPDDESTTEAQGRPADHDRIYNTTDAPETSLPRNSGYYVSFSELCVICISLMLQLVNGPARGHLAENDFQLLRLQTQRFNLWIDGFDGRNAGLDEAIWKSHHLRIALLKLFSNFMESLSDLARVLMATIDDRSRQMADIRHVQLRLLEARSIIRETAFPDSSQPYQLSISDESSSDNAIEAIKDIENHVDCFLELSPALQMPARSRGGARASAKQTTTAARRISTAQSSSRGTSIVGSQRTDSFAMKASKRWSDTTKVDSELSGTESRPDSEFQRFRKKLIDPEVKGHFDILRDSINEDLLRQNIARRVREEGAAFERSNSELKHSREAAEEGSLSREGINQYEEVV